MKAAPCKLQFLFSLATAHKSNLFPVFPPLVRICTSWLIEIPSPEFANFLRFRQLANLNKTKIITQSERCLHLF